MSNAPTAALPDALAAVTRATSATPDVHDADDLRLLDDPAEWGAFSRPAQGRSASWESHLVDLPPSGVP